MRFIKGQVQLGVVGFTAISAFAASWLGNYVLNSPEKASAEIKQVSERVTSLEADNKTMKDWLSRIENKLDKAISK